MEYSSVALDFGPAVTEANIVGTLGPRKRCCWRKDGQHGAGTGKGHYDSERSHVLRLGSNTARRQEAKICRQHH